jgi:hypothetical protein
VTNEADDRAEPPQTGTRHSRYDREQPDRIAPGDNDGLRPRPATGVEELRRRAMTLGFAVVALAILSLLFAIYWQLARPILWAVTFAVLFYPLHRLVVRVLRGRESVAAVVSTAALLAIVIIPSVFVVSSLLGEAR